MKKPGGADAMRQLLFNIAFSSLLFNLASCVAHHRTVTLAEDGCMEFVEGQRNFDEQFRPIEGTECKTIFDLEWGDGMVGYDSAIVTISGDAWDGTFRRDAGLDAQNPTAQVCLTDEAWGQSISELNVIIDLWFGGKSVEYANALSGNYHSKGFGGVISWHFTQVAVWRLVGDPPKQGEVGVPLHLESTTVPVDIRLTARTSANTYWDFDPTWQFSWEKADPCQQKGRRK
jgi:hypothetical protein